MSADLLDRLQQDKLDDLEQLIADYQGTAGAAADEAAAVADFFVDEGIALRQTSLRHWDYHWSTALAGKIADLKAHGSKLRSVFDRSARLLAQHAAVARAYADASGQEVARLALLEEHSKSFPTWVEECMARWELLDRPRKPADRERIAAAQAAFARGECEPAADILSRLEAGGPLVQE